MAKKMSREECTGREKKEGTMKNTKCSLISKSSRIVNQVAYDMHLRAYFPNTRVGIDAGETLFFCPDNILVYRSIGCGDIFITAKIRLNLSCDGVAFRWYILRNADHFIRRGGKTEYLRIDNTDYTYLNNSLARAHDCGAAHFYQEEDEDTWDTQFYGIGLRAINCNDSRIKNLWEGNNCPVLEASEITITEFKRRQSILRNAS